MAIFQNQAEIEKLDREHRSERPQLEEALIADLKAVLDNPHRLKRTVRFMFEHLTYISSIEGCEIAFIEIVSLLATWPMRLGFAKQWYGYIDSAYNICLRFSLNDYLESILLLKSKVFFDSGKFDEALDFSLKAIDNAKLNENPVILAQALLHTVTIYLYKQQSEQAVFLVESIDRLTIITEFSPMIAQFYLKLASLQVYRRIGNNDKIQETIELTEPLLKKGLDKRSSAVWHHNVGLVKWDSGEHIEALARYRMSKDLFAQVSDKSEIGLTTEIGLTLWSIGQLKEATLYLSEAQIKADEILDYLRGLKIDSYLALLHFSKGELDLATEYTASALKKAISVKYTSDISRIIGNRGILKIHLGDYAGALQDLELDKQSLQEKNQQLACTLTNLARLYNLMGDQEKGRLFALEALDIATEKQYRTRKVIALRALAECSDKKRAIDLLNQAVDLSKDYQFLDEAACYLSLSNLQDNVFEKQRYWELGDRLLRHIGASKWLATATPQNPPLIPLIG